MIQLQNYRTRQEAAGRRAVATAERRDSSPLGAARRRRFDDSLNLLCALGLSPDALEYYRRSARVTRQLPHEVVAMTAEKAARDACLYALLTALGSGPA